MRIEKTEALTKTMLLRMLRIVRRDRNNRRAEPAFPTSDLERTGIVFAALMQANRPLDASALARSFRQGAKVEPAISHHPLYSDNIKSSKSSHSPSESIPPRQSLRAKHDHEHKQKIP